MTWWLGSPANSACVERRCGALAGAVGIFLPAGEKPLKLARSDFCPAGEKLTVLLTVLLES